MKFVINQLPAGVCMKTMLFVLALAVAGQAFSRDFWEGDADQIGATVGIEWSFSQHAKVPYVLDTDIQIRNTPERACRALQASVRPDTVGSYAVHVPTGLDTTRPWTKLAPFIGIYGDEADIFECYGMALQDDQNGQCWTTNYRMAEIYGIDRVANKTDADKACGFIGAAINQTWIYSNPPENAANAEVYANAASGCGTSRWACKDVNDPRDRVIWETTAAHIQCPQGEKRIFGGDNNWRCVEDDDPDLRIGAFHLRIQNAETCTQGKLTDRGTIELDSGYRPYCWDGGCLNRNVYMFADYTGSDNASDGRDGQWDSQGKILPIEYTDSLGYDRIKWMTEVTKDSFRPEQGTDINPPRLVGYMFMLGNGEVLDSGCFSTEVF